MKTKLIFSLLYCQIDQNSKVPITVISLDADIQYKKWNSTLLILSGYLLKFDFAADFTVNFTLFSCMLKLIRNDLGSLVL